MLLRWRALAGITSLFVPMLAWAQVGSLVSQNCVNECRDEPGDNVLALVAAEGSECLKPGEEGVFELWQRNLKQKVRGYQAFIRFNPACMQVLDIEMTDDPYNYYPVVRWDNNSGTIDLIIGILPPREPTDKDALLARIKFRADEDLTCQECGICFRPFDPPTRFSDEFGRDVEPCLKFGETLIDGTPPQGTCPPQSLEYECREQVPDCDPNLPGWTDDCSELLIDCTDEDNGGQGCPGSPLIIRRTWTATDCAGNTSRCVQEITVIDDDPPTLTRQPVGRTIECNGQEHEREFEEWLENCGGATAEDNCGEVVCEPRYEKIAGCCATWYADVTFRFSDRCGNYADSTTVRFEVVDTTSPVIDRPAQDVTVECDPNVNDRQFEDWLAAHGGALATDACCGPDELTWSFEYDKITGCCATWYADVIFTVTDNCGNSSRTRARFTVVDTTPPTFLDGCGGRIKVFPDVGACGAYVELPTPRATDVCCEEVLVEGFRSDGRGLDEQYPIGDTIVYWIAADACGNEEVCQLVVQVEPDNLMDVYVELKGVFKNSVRRCIHFQIFTCDGEDEGLPRDEVIQFLRGADRAWGRATLRVPACPTGQGERYVCVTAQDLLHTLRATVSPTVVQYQDADGTIRTKYLVEFKDPREMGGHWLLGGNWDACQYPEGGYIDILDFGVWSWQFGESYDCDGDGTVDGNSSCGCACFPHADADGDGRVTMDDLSPWLLHVVMYDEDPCCGESGALTDEKPGPVWRISLDELRARGWGELAAGDWNHDGWLDIRDVKFLMQGGLLPQPGSPLEGDID